MIKIDMKSILLLTKEESIAINGGDIYDAGYKVGKFFADVVDWYEGFCDGFKAGFDN
ncbi:MAG TPA: hypothetical protein VEP89_17145 [Draconibacterium sp.]|nr:hypothetical protein [Draconibacterium sp.]